MAAKARQTSGGDEMNADTYAKPEVVKESPGERIVMVRLNAGKGDVGAMTKETVAQLESESRELWEKTLDDNRAALLVLLRDTLLKIAQEPEMWVPSSLVKAETGKRLDIWLSINMNEIEDEVMSRRLETETQILSATTGLIGIRDELLAAAEEE